MGVGNKHGQGFNCIGRIVVHDLSFLLSKRLSKVWMQVAIILLLVAAIGVVVYFKLIAK